MKPTSISPDEQWKFMKHSQVMVWEVYVWRNDIIPKISLPPLGIAYMCSSRG